MVQETKASHTNNLYSFIATLSLHLLEDFLSSLWKETQDKIWYILLMVLCTKNKSSLDLFWKLIQSYLEELLNIVFIHIWYLSWLSDTFQDQIFRSKIQVNIQVKFKSVSQFHNQKVTFSNIFTLQNNVYFSFLFHSVKISTVGIADFICIINLIISDIVSSLSNAHFLPHAEDLHFSQIVDIFSVNFVVQFCIFWIDYKKQEWF